MNTSTGPIMTYSRYWLPELVVLLTLALASIALFAVPPLDIDTLLPFYHPEAGYPWPMAFHPFWSLLYRTAPWLTGSLAVAGVALLVIGVVHREEKHVRVYGLFLLLCVALGPGLIINMVLKDHWGRPRPRQLVEFGGRLEYRQPLLPACASAGIPCKSFPCGHCSVGYLHGAGWWIWRRRYPRWGAASLALGLTLGTLLGLERMAAGAHFLSDAVWSALIVYGVAHCLYYYALRIPAREDSHAVLYPLIEGNRRLKTAAVAVSVFLGLAVIAGGLLASSQYGDLTSTIKLTNFPARPEVFELRVDTLDVELRLVADPSGEIECGGSIYGFGLPTNKITSSWEFEEHPTPTLRHHIILTGVFTDIDGTALLRIPVQGLRVIRVHVKRGDIIVVDGTGGARLPRLDLSTGDGRVHLPSPHIGP